MVFIYIAIFLIVAIAVYITLVLTDHKQTAQQLAAAQLKYEKLRQTVKELYKTSHSAKLSTEQRHKVETLLKQAVQETRAQADIVSELQAKG